MVHFARDLFVVRVGFLCSTPRAMTQWLFSTGFVWTSSGPQEKKHLQTRIETMRQNEKMSPNNDETTGNKSEFCIQHERYDAMIQEEGFR
jgi:hypothetical protein